MVFARAKLGLMVPEVHRTFLAAIPDGFGSTQTGHFIVMDYIHGKTLEEVWPSLDAATKGSIAAQVADAIEKMQASTISDLPPGPIGRGEEELFQGPWFTDYGAGPFPSLDALEEWFNHKIDVCDMVHQLPPGTPRFRFNDMVFTHQDIAPRNLILCPDGKVCIVDWGCAGVYPRGFEQVTLQELHWHREFADMALAKLSDQHVDLGEQYRAFAYALSVGRNL